jgi:hypothetical protein
MNNNKHLLIVSFLCCLLISGLDLFAQNRDLSQNKDELNELKQKLYNKEIELAKSNRTLGYVIAAPTVAWTCLITTTTILYPPSLEDNSWIPIIASAVASAILAKIGIDIIIDSNNKLSELEKSNSNYSFMYKQDTKTFGLSFTMNF